ncbi:MAG: cupin domain-containing protein [Bacteroides sp.]|nr:cupin domain-containing protein [Bacteroides sp.]
MKMNVWKKCVCMCGVSLFMATNLYAVQLANNGTPNDPVKKTRSETFIYEKNKEWKPAGEGVTRQIMGYDGQVMLVKVKFEKGAIGTPHTHYHTQTTYVASGKFEFTVGGEKKIVAAGDGIYIEPDVLHGCICLEPGILIDCFSPMRADFLK